MAKSKDFVQMLCGIFCCCPSNDVEDETQPQNPPQQHPLPCNFVAPSPPPGDQFQSYRYLPAVPPITPPPPLVLMFTFPPTPSDGVTCRILTTGTLLEDLVGELCVDDVVE